MKLKNRSLLNTTFTGMLMSSVLFQGCSKNKVEIEPRRPLTAQHVVHSPKPTPPLENLVEETPEYPPELLRHVFGEPKGVEETISTLTYPKLVTVTGSLVNFGQSSNDLPLDVSGDLIDLESMDQSKPPSDANLFEPRVSLKKYKLSQSDNSELPSPIIEVLASKNKPTSNTRTLEKREDPYVIEYTEYEAVIPFELLEALPPKSDIEFSVSVVEDLRDNTIRFDKKFTTSHREPVRTTHHETELSHEDKRLRFIFPTDHLSNERRERHEGFSDFLRNFEHQKTQGNLEDYRMKYLSIAIPIFEVPESNDKIKNALLVLASAIERRDHEGNYREIGYYYPFAPTNGEGPHDFYTKISHKIKSAFDWLKFLDINQDELVTWNENDQYAEAMHMAKNNRKKGEAQTRTELREELRALEDQLKDTFKSSVPFHPYKIVKTLGKRRKKETKSKYDIGNQEALDRFNDPLSYEEHLEQSEHDNLFDKRIKHKRPVYGFWQRDYTYSWFDFFERVPAPVVNIHSDLGYLNENRKQTIKYDTRVANHATLLNKDAPIHCDGFLFPELYIVTGQYEKGSWTNPHFNDQTKSNYRKAPYRLIYKGAEMGAKQTKSLVD